jgi:hypothetical protein
MSEAMEMDLGSPRGAKRKADALDDSAVPRRIKVRTTMSTAFSMLPPVSDC